MGRFGRLLQVVCRPGLVIELGGISDPACMILVTVWFSRAVVVLVDWADPNGDEANDWM